MANIHILSDPPSDYGAFSGGTWASGLSLPNLVTQQPKQVARSVGVGAAATRFVCDLGLVRPVSSFALVGSNFTRNATVRFRVSNAADGSDPMLDVTIPGFPPNVAFGSSAWGAFPWAGYLNDPKPGGETTFYQAASSAFGRYVLVDILDTANPAGYVQIGRFMAGAAFVPKFNFTYGASFSFVDDTKATRSVGGQLWFDKKAKRRRFACAFDALSEDDAYGAVYDLKNRVGLSGNLLLVYDPKDRADIVARRTLYGGLTELAGIVTANASNDAPYTWSLVVEELT